ncbi:MAG: EamA family transporter [Bryobacteraceae bacterium]
MERHPQFKAYVALAAVCFFWGATYTAIRMSLESFAPMVLVCVRFLISGSLMVALVRWRGHALPRGRELRAAVLSGVLILGIGNGALVVAEMVIPSGLAGLFITISPFWMVVIEALMGGVALHAPTLAGMAIGLGGAALLLAPDVFGQTLGGGTLQGFLILQIGMAGWSFGSIFQRRRTANAHPFAIGAVHQLAAGVAFIPVAALFPGHSPAYSARSVAAMFYLVIFGSMVGYTAYTYALAKLPVAVTSIHTYVNSVVAVALGWLFYREPFGQREAAAMMVIFTGVALVKKFARA